MIITKEEFEKLKFGDIIYVSFRKLRSDYIKLQEYTKIKCIVIDSPFLNGIQILSSEGQYRRVRFDSVNSITDRNLCGNCLVSMICDQSKYMLKCLKKTRIVKRNKNVNNKDRI